MHTNNLKLLILVAVVMAFMACAHSKPLELPSPQVPDGAGWHSY